MNVIVASLIAALSVAPATPAPRATLAPPAPFGEIYQGGPPVFFMFAKTPGQKTQMIHGYISEYGVLTERDSEYPVAFIEFVEDGAKVPRKIYIAEPLQVNGRTYMCGGGKTTFERLYQVCPALPAQVMGPSHKVSVAIFEGRFPNGALTTVTSNVQSTP